MMHVQNERCVRWRYGLDGETPSRDVPEHASTIDVGDARRITIQTALCKGIRQCSVRIERGIDVDPLQGLGCL